jgi:hypothetical protein
MRRVAAVLTLALLLFSCAYGPGTWRHSFGNAMPEPGGHQLAAVVISSEECVPTGVLARFPDGGRPRVVRERVRLWLCNADSGTALPLAVFERPREVRDRFSAWIVGWDPPGERRAVYMEVTGEGGAKSAPQSLRWLLRIELRPDRGAASAVAFLPNEARRPPPQGPMRGGPELQVSLSAGAIGVWTETRPELAELFRLDPRSGDLVLTPGASLTPPSPNAAAPARAPAPAEPAIDFRPAPDIWCDSVMFFLRAVSSQSVKRGMAPFEDYVAARDRPACSEEIEGIWISVNPRHTPWDALDDWLTGLGFVRDARYDTDGPDGSSALYRHGERYCAYSASWWSSKPAPPGAAGGPEKEPPTSYRLTVWSGTAAAPR